MRWTLMLEAEDKEGIQSENSGSHGGEYDIVARYNIAST
jgi:hypothetical protein